MADIKVRAENKGDILGVLSFCGEDYRCTIGKSGLGNKEEEGDNITPIGKWKIRRVFYRADKVERPKSVFPVFEIAESDGWCDDIGNENYNRLITLPFLGSHEKMWREDSLYDVVVELGFNDNPVIKGGGSAIFMHIMQIEQKPTAGCIGLKQDDLLRVLNRCTIETCVDIRFS